MYNDLGVMIGLVHVFIPFMVLSIAGPIRGIDQELELAARSLGGGFWQTFWRVTFPLSMPGGRDDPRVCVDDQFLRHPVAPRRLQGADGADPRHPHDHGTVQLARRQRVRDPFLCDHDRHTLGLSPRARARMAVMVVLITERLVGLEALYLG
jgi:hypothetical protein